MASERRVRALWSSGLAARSFARSFFQLRHCRSFRRSSGSSGLLLGILAVLDRVVAGEIARDEVVRPLVVTRLDRRDFALAIEQGHDLAERHVAREDRRVFRVDAVHSQ